MGGLGLKEVRSHGDVKQRGREVAVADHEGLTRGALVLALARGYSCGADEWLGSVDTPLGLGSILPAAKLDAFKNMACASAARAGASGLYAAKQLADASEKAQKRSQQSEPAPASREDLLELSISQLKKLARD